MKNTAKQLCVWLGLTARPTATISFTRHFQYCSAFGTLPLKVKARDIWRQRLIAVNVSQNDASLERLDGVRILIGWGRTKASN